MSIQKNVRNTGIIVALVFVALVGSLVYLTRDSYPPPASERLDNVVRIFMHEPNLYTVWLEQPGAKEIKQERVGANEVQIFADAEPGTPMWVVFHWKKTRFVGIHLGASVVEFHIHAPADVLGAGWDHGKYGSGQTEVVQ